jgi:hypothetical protein
MLQLGLSIRNWQTLESFNNNNNASQHQQANILMVVKPVLG